MTDTFVVDTDLGEALQENEEQIAREIADAIAARIQQGQRPALRDAHAKAHGCVQATFRVEDDLRIDADQAERLDAWLGSVVDRRDRPCQRSHAGDPQCRGF